MILIINYIMAYMNDYINKSSSIFIPTTDLNNKRSAAIMCFKRKERFVEGYNINNNLKELLNDYFQDSDKLVQDGLTIHYNRLKKYVEENNLIGLILYGSDINKIDNSDQYISEYVTLDNKRINLEITTLCQILLKNYFIDEKYIDSLCEKTHNFKIYYQNNK